MSGNAVEQETGEWCPGWHHWRYDQKSGLTWCREHGRLVPKEEAEAAWDPRRA